MAHLTISLQVNHVSKSQYSPFKSRLMLLQLAGVFFIYLMCEMKNQEKVTRIKRQH